MRHLKSEIQVNPHFPQNEAKYIRTQFFSFVDKLYAQLSLLRAITGSMQIHCDDYTASFLAKKLLRFITAMKCLAQAGSNFNKNCLLTIGNVMLDVDEVIIVIQYI